MQKNVLLISYSIKGLQLEVVGGGAWNERSEFSKTAIEVVFPGVGSETRLYFSSMYMCAFYIQHVVATFSE